MKYDLNLNIDRSNAEVRFKYLMEKKKEIELKEIRKTRSLSQNSYLHVVISLYAIHFGYTSNEAKTDLKRGCGFMSYEKNEKMYLRETRGLDSKEMTAFIDWIRNLSGVNGCYIPTSEEYIEAKYQIDKEIDLHKQYL